jgi:hypothetical protein
VTYVDKAQRRESSMSGDERRLLLELERHLEAVTPNFYGWGYVDRNPLRQASANVGSDSVRVARYMARNLAGYLAHNSSTAVDEPLPGRSLRSHVSRRLTRVTGVTIRNLRRARYLYVCIARRLALPDWPERELEAVWLLLSEPLALAARAP